MERAPLFHLSLIPRKTDSELRGPAYIGQQPPLTSTFDEAQAMAQIVREGFESS
jgi:hypothetical protein